MGSAEVLRTIFDNISSPVLLIDRNYTVVEANRAALSHVCQRGIDTRRSKRGSGYTRYTDTGSRVNSSSRNSWRLPSMKSPERSIT